ncbi:dihydrolipoamide dehydrogenase [Cognatishimia sp. SS12]|uniref:methyltransferase domain-containing protein n=1 Tax=Cognatishimia sp. SS12 TaxID=2979465 RepID=UPI00232EBB30|nr:methyltransferase domain-containing protein [Cognatishimia sp. SS12]MDC0737492.1 dihydrolipoamide dehydrogenase [Cognatishimia sp. SS12]
MISLNRVMMNRRSRKILSNIGVEDMDVAEISGRWGKSLNPKSYVQYMYPGHDICDGPVRYANGEVLKYDLILANQVWSHLDRPYKATQNVLEMLRPGGYFWLAVPFFMPYHPAPQDCTRWSARGLRNLLIEAGFPENDIQAAQWGNRAAAKRNLEDKWPPEYDPKTDSLEHDPDFPIVAWALARKA